MAELKSCPFCGGEAGAGYGIWDYNVWGVSCKECGAYVCADWQEDTKENAIEAWNRRVADG